MNFGFETEIKEFKQSIGKLYDAIESIEFKR